MEIVKTIHARDIGWGWTDNFLLNQTWKCINPVTLPLCGAGLWYLYAVPAGKRYRMLGWLYAIPLIALLIPRGRDHYAPAYPALLAAGAVWDEQWVSSLSGKFGLHGRRVAWTTLVVAGVVSAAVTLPITLANSAWWRLADRMNGNFNYEIGWADLVESVAKIRDSLPVEDQATLGILAGDEGEAGAVNLYGPSFHLPKAISGMNSNWTPATGIRHPRR